MRAVDERSLLQHPAAFVSVLHPSSWRIVPQQLAREIDSLCRENGGCQAWSRWPQCANITHHQNGADTSAAQVGISSVWCEGNICNMHLDQLPICF